MYRIGIDLGGTNIAAGIIDENYKILAKGSTPTLVGKRDSEEIVKDIATLCKKLCTQINIDVSDVQSIGIASPGIVDDVTGEVVAAYNMQMFHFPIIPLLKKYINVKEMHIANDANAAAWGEAIAGAAKGSKSSIMITLGTGLGGGIVMENKIYTGFNNAAGELGHIVVQVGGRPCTCGRCGCWETYSSATGLIKTTKEKMEEYQKAGKETALFKLAQEEGKVSARTAFNAKRLGDQAGIEIVDEYIKYLASGIADMINIFQPEVFSIGGGVSNEGQYLLDLLNPLITRDVFGKGAVKPTTLRIAQLRNDAGIVGGAVLGS